MDGEMWTDEDEDAWTDGEDMSFGEGITESETDPSWEMSSEGVEANLDDIDVPAMGQHIQSSPMGATVVSMAGEGTLFPEPYGMNSSS